MTDPDLHPLPITPNDPLAIFSSNKISFESLDTKKQAKKFRKASNVSESQSNPGEEYEI
jgi:hypothetical protein